MFVNHVLKKHHLTSIFSSPTKSQFISFCSSFSSLSNVQVQTHPNLLELCSLSPSLPQIKQVHAFGVLTGFLPASVSLVASLILQYATYGDSRTYRFLFQQTVGLCRNAFLWNTLVRANSVAFVRDEFKTYNQMVRAGIRPDGYTFPFVLKECSDCSELQKGMEIHGVVFKLGFDGDVFVGNTLMQLYGNCAHVIDAKRVFDEMCEKDKVSWNTIISLSSLNGFNAEALDYFKAMSVMSSSKPDLVSIVSVLPVCADTRDRMMTSLVHCYVSKVGLSGHVKIGNAFIDAYGKCGDEKASKQVFDEMVDRNGVSWNAIITSFTYTGRNMNALEALRSMIDSGMTPNSIAISSMLPVLGELGLSKLGKEIHGFSLRMGIESDVFIANSLIDMYAKTGYPRISCSVFDNMVEKNIVSWNAMIANLTQNRLEFAALDLIRQMQNYDEFPNSVTFTNILPACARLNFLHTGKELHARIIRAGYAFDLFVSNALTDMYSKCGSLGLALNVFDISVRDEVSYNILILGYSQTIACLESLNLFKEMRLLGMKPDIVSFMGVISACANLAAIKQGKEIHGFLVRKLLHTHLFAANSLLDLYTKCGQIDVAAKIFESIENKDVASWNTMILGYGMLGELDTAINYFEAMKEDGVGYDSVSFIAVLSACSHGGLLEKGRKYFMEMKDLNIEPTHMHYACMVDLLGRAGLMEEAADLIRGLPIAPDANIWGALLGACRIYGNVELGRWAAEHLFELKPQHCGYYILLSNMYAEAERWEEADRVRQLMKSRGARKNPGCSWVQIGDQVHAFLVGEKMEDLDSGLLLSEC